MVHHVDFYYSFIHSIAMCRMWWFLAVLRSFCHPSLLCTFSCHPSPPTSLPSSLTSSCHLFLGLPLNLVVPKFIYNTLLGILFSSILCTCPNQHNLFNLNCLYYSRFFEHLYKFLNWLISSNFLFHCHILGLKFFYTLSFQKCSIAFYLSLLASKSDFYYTNIWNLTSRNVFACTWRHWYYLDVLLGHHKWVSTSDWLWQCCSHPTFELYWRMRTSQLKTQTHTQNTIYFQAVVNFPIRMKHKG